MNDYLRAKNVIEIKSLNKNNSSFVEKRIAVALIYLTSN